MGATTYPHLIEVDDKEYYTAGMLTHFGKLNKHENTVTATYGEGKCKIVSFKYEEDLVAFKLKFKLKFGTNV